MANIYEPEFDEEGEGYRRARLGDQAGCDQLGISLWELAPAASSPFHYHLQNEELLVVLRGRVSVRSQDGWRDLSEGDVVPFPRGPRGVHALENRGDAPTRVLLISEMNGPNVSVYPDHNQIGIFDAPRRRDRRLGALFDFGDAVSGYGGGEPEP